MSAETGVSSIDLRPISASAGAALREGRPPRDVRVEADHPTEFSAGVGAQVGAEGAVGPFFLHRAADGVVVGEIGGAFVGPGLVEIGYAVVPSCRGRGYATDAVRAFARWARELGGVQRLVAHTPLERPASARVLAKAGFAHAGQEEDQHEGAVIRVDRWELTL
jgi:RimJ/RimL family protein N-acetyltransferase